MIIRNMFIALCAIMSLSCGITTPLDINYHGSNKGLAKTLQAADYWNQACGADLVNVHVGSGGLDLHEQDQPCGPDDTGLETDNNYVFVFYQTICVQVDPGELAVLVHEMGHALGLHHPFPPNGTIMDPKEGTDQLLDGDEYQLQPGLINQEQCDVARSH